LSTVREGGGLREIFYIVEIFTNTVWKKECNIQSFDSYNFLECAIFKIKLTRLGQKAQIVTKPKQNNITVIFILMF
jgi:hypothetical protein